MRPPLSSSLMAPHASAQIGSRAARWKLPTLVVALASSAIAGAALVSAASASVEVAVDAHDATLRVDAAGDAQVSWISSGGRRRTLVVARDGSLHFGEALAGSDVSHPTEAVNLPWAAAIRQTPDGTFYALQAWQRLDSGPTELRFSRWQGAPVVGKASFHGKPIYGYAQRLRAHRSTPTAETSTSTPSKAATGSE